MGKFKVGDKVVRTKGPEDTFKHGQQAEVVRVVDEHYIELRGDSRLFMAANFELEDHGLERAADLLRRKGWSVSPPPPRSIVVQGRINQMTLTKGKDMRVPTGIVSFSWDTLVKVARAVIELEDEK